jgi:hypothetical protein
MPVHGLVVGNLGVLSASSDPDVYSLSGAGDLGLGESATVYFYSNGSGEGLHLGEFFWVLPSSATTRYSHEIRATHASGPAPTGDSLGSWLSLSSTRAWSNDTVGTTTLTIEIRRVSSGEIMVSGNIELHRDTL